MFSSIYSSIKNHCSFRRLPSTSDHQENFISKVPKEVLLEIFCNQAHYSPQNLALVSKSLNSLSQTPTYNQFISGMFSKHLNRKIETLSEPTAPRVCSYAYNTLFSELSFLNLDPSVYLKEGDLLSYKEADRLIKAKNFCLFCSQIPGIGVENILNTPDEIYAAKTAYLAQLQDPSFDPKQVESLSMDNLGLTRLPEQIGLFTGLKALNLQNNKLSSLPDSVGRLRKLGIFFLQNNKLSSLPDSFCKLKSLYHLVLRNNKLSSLPDSFGTLKRMHELYLQNNELSSLPDSFGNLKKLSMLRLEDNKVSFLHQSFDNNRGQKRI